MLELLDTFINECKFARVYLIEFNDSFISYFCFRDKEFGGSYVFNSFFRAAGNSMLFRINR